MSSTHDRVVPPRLTAHLTQWLGTWPPVRPLQVIGSPLRVEPGWDGRVHPALAVADPVIGAALSVPPAAAHDVHGWSERGGRAAVLAHLPDLLGLPGRGTYEAVFRWSVAPTDLPDAGRWISADAAEVPMWLKPFTGPVLVAADPDGRHLAGVGIKRHNDDGHELSVVTIPAARGQGLARALVAQAARRVLDEGAIPTYLHERSNTASARVADAAGFTDHGFTSFGISEAPRTDRPTGEQAEGGKQTNHDDPNGAADARLHFGPDSKRDAAHRAAEDGSRR